MRRTTFLFVSMAVLSTAAELAPGGEAQTVLSRPHLSAASDTCQEIANSVSSASGVYYKGSAKYQEDISHWAVSSTQLSACSFEPGTVEDVGIGLQILYQTQTNFAVKGGGHTANPGFSSTQGVQIAMSRFSEVVYDSETQTAVIGAGLLWDDVYAALEPYGVNVVGGRVPGIGVAGFTLGGGYSWLTNQYGLTIDTVQMFELVMPNGTAIDVTDSSNPDLFFALKGGLNNFGIVTRFTLKTFPQTQVWGGIMTYGLSYLEQVNQATANFAANVQDPKAATIVSYNYLPFLEDNVILMVFYDAPAQPEGIFDEFLNLPWTTQEVGVQSFSSFVQSIPSKITNGERAIFNSISVSDVSLSFLEAVVNQTTYAGQNLPDDVFFISYDVEPFLPTLFSHNTTPSAYPPDRTQAIYPLNIYYAWLFPSSDETVWEAIKQSAQVLQNQVSLAEHDERETATEPVVYTNYAIFDTPLADLYGNNLQRLQEIKSAVDPHNVMGLAGGFKI